MMHFAKLFTYRKLLTVKKITEFTLTVCLFTFLILLSRKGNCQGSGPIYEEPLYYGPYNTISLKNYYIRVYLNFIDPEENWAQGNMTPRYLSILDNLNLAYNKHHIFFVPYFLDSNCDGNSTESYEVNTSTTNIEIEDALTINDRGDSGSPNGLSGSIPDIWVEVSGIENGNPAATGSNVIHEVGHNLGLVHTHHGTVLNIAPDCNETNSACPEGVSTDVCYCCGDHVCDTPYNDEWSIELSSSCNDPNPSVPEEIYKNYMSYVTPTDCRNRFSEEQASRMRYYLEYHTKLQDMQVLSTFMPGGNLNTVSGDIIIESGVYEITTPLYMLPDAKIVVKKGARLKIYDKITAACESEMWEGIIVEGTSGGSQSTDSTTNAYQGWVSLQSDGIIEHAKCGIRLEAAEANGTPVAFSGGGLLYPCVGTFRNCIISVRFGAFFPVTPIGSWILDTDFEIDDDYRGGGEQPIFIDLNFIKHLRIFSSRFKDLRTSCGGKSTRAIGIDAKSASFQAQTNTFEDLAFGIIADQPIPIFGSFLTFNNDFLRCYEGLHAIKASSFNLSGNDFDISIPTACTTNEEIVGVTLEGNTAGFTFKDNTFTSISTPTVTDNHIGTKVQGTQGGVGNVIFGNHFSDLTIGNLALGFNGLDDGITYICNTHDGVIDDYIVDVNGTVQIQQRYTSSQGTPAPTGNEFSGVSGNFNNFNTSLDDNLTYFYRGSVNPLNPQYPGYASASYSGIATLTSLPDANEACGETPPCLPPCPGTDNEDYKEDFYDKRLTWEATTIALGGANGGQIAILKDSVQNLKSVMDRYSSIVVQNYATDTTSSAIQIDSLLAWLKLSETYSGDLQRASHYFLTGQLGKYDTLWAHIPSKYGLADDALSEFEELGLIYDLVRLEIVEDTLLTDIPPSIIDSLGFWSGWCSEPGFLAKVLLRWNGIATQQDCETAQRVVERQRNIGNNQFSQFAKSDIMIYPNPADQSLTLDFGEEQLYGDIVVRLYNMQGHLAADKKYTLVGNNVLFQLDEIPIGIYVIEVQLDDRNPKREKISIIH